MSKPGNEKGATIDVGLMAARTVAYELLGATVKFKGTGGGYCPKPVAAELEVSIEGLQRLLQRAYDNKSKRSSDGPLTVKIKT